MIRPTISYLSKVLVFTVYDSLIQIVNYSLYIWRYVVLCWTNIMLSYFNSLWFIRFYIKCCASIFLNKTTLLFYNEHLKSCYLIQLCSLLPKKLNYVKILIFLIIKLKIIGRNFQRNLSLTITFITSVKNINAIAAKLYLCY